MIPKKTIIGWKAYRVFDSNLFILFSNASQFVNRSIWKQIEGNGRSNSNLEITLQKNSISFKSRLWRNIQQSWKCFTDHHLGGALETEWYVHVFSHFKSPTPEAANGRKIFESSNILTIFKYVHHGKLANNQVICEFCYKVLLNAHKT